MRGLVILKLGAKKILGPCVSSVKEGMGKPSAIIAP